MKNFFLKKANEKNVVPVSPETGIQEHLKSIEILEDKTQQLAELLSLADRITDMRDDAEVKATFTSLKYGAFASLVVLGVTTPFIGPVAILPSMLSFIIPVAGNDMMPGKATRTLHALKKLQKSVAENIQSLAQNAPIEQLAQSPHFSTVAMKLPQLKEKFMLAVAQENFTEKLHKIEKPQQLKKPEDGFRL